MAGENFFDPKMDVEMDGGSASESAVMEDDIELSRVVRKNEIDTMKGLISSGKFSRMEEWLKDDGYTLLKITIANGHKEMTKLLLKHGAQPYPRIKECTNELLHDVIRNGDIELTEMLLDRGANVNAVNDNYQTPLHYAASRAGPAQVMELLLKNNASVTAYCKFGKMPLHYATESGHLQNVECLLNHEAPVNGRIRKMTIANNESPVSRTIKLAHDSYGYTPLHCACKLDNEELVTLMLSKGADVNATAYNEMTPLHVAAERKLEKNLKLLLERGANIDARADNGDTVLDIAVKMEDPVTLAHILKSRPSMDDDDRRKVLRKALLQSTSEDSIKVVNALVECGFTVCSEDANDLDLLHGTVEKGCLKLFEDLLKYGANKNQWFLNTLRLDYSRLHVKSSGYLIAMAELAIKHAPDQHAKTVCAQTLMFTAIRATNMDMIKFLLANGANLIDHDGFGMTPLHAVVYMENHMPITIHTQNMLNYLRNIGHTSFETENRMEEFENQNSIRGAIAKLCLSNGASVDALTDRKFTALHYAAAGNHATVVKVLLEYKADVNCVALKDGNKTSLHYSAAAGNEIISKMLIKNGAKLNVTDEDGKTPIYVACYCSHANVVKILLEYGAEIDSRDSGGKTLLHIAALQGSTEIVKILLHHGITDVDLTSINGSTPLAFALLGKWTEIVKDLLDYGSDIGRTRKKFDEVLFYARTHPKSRRFMGPSRPPRCTETSELLKHRVGHYQVLVETYCCGKLSSRADDLRQTWKIVQQHIVKMKALHLFAPGIISDIVWNDKHLNFQRECEQEIENLKSTKISDNRVSYYDVLMKGSRQLSSYANNVSIREALELADYKYIFPIYSGMIHMNFKKSVHENRLMNQSRYWLNSLAGFEIPHLPSMEILNYLGTQDLNNFIKACAQLED